MWDSAQALSGGRNHFKRTLAKVVSIQSDNTITVQINRDATDITGVRYFGHYAPVAGSLVWLDSDGLDMVAVGAVAGLGGAAIAARVEKNANQTLSTSNSPAQVTFATASLSFDTASMFDDANDQFVITVPGVYLLNGGVEWISFGDTGQRLTQIRVSSGGSSSIRGALRTSNIANVGHFHSVTAIDKLAAGDKVQLWASQSSGGSLSAAVQSGALTYLALTYLGPSA